MSTETIKLNRKLFASALVTFAEHVIELRGPEGYAETVFTAFTKHGLEIGSSPGALRDWLHTQAGWRKRYESAVERYRKRIDGIDPNHPVLRSLERKLRESEKDAARLREQLGQYDNRQTVFEQLAETLESVVEPLEPRAPLIDFASAKEDAHPVDLVAALTDQHADEEIAGPATWGLERYNFDVYCLRLERWARIIVEYATQHLPKHRVERGHILHMGDACHGDGHNNKYRNFFGNTMKAAIAVADAQSEAFEYILQYIPYLSVVCVPGNHPRTTVKKDHADPHDNFDFMVAALMAARCSRLIADGRLDIHAPKSWTAYLDVRGKVLAVNHGDDVIGTWGIPWYGFAKKQARVQAMVGRKDVSVDFFWYGHHHTDIGVTENSARAIHSGAFTATDAWTAEKLAAGGEPMQAAMMLDDRPGMRSRLLDIPIWLRDPGVEDKYWAGKLKPMFGRTNALTQLGASDGLAYAGQFPLIQSRK